MQGNILIIAGSDSGGGAGIQADIKTVSALGGYAATAITALTAQNTQTVAEVVPVSAGFVSLQMDMVLTDIAIDVMKTGMLLNAEVASAVADMLSLYPDIPCVVDPVMVATSGSVLLEQDAVNVMKEQLIPHAYVLTPNLPEASLLSGIKVHTEQQMEAAAKKILNLGCKHVLIKGGHGDGKQVTNLLMGQDKKPYWFNHPRIQSNNTHGTGCTMASAIATFLAQKYSLSDAVTQAADYVQQAITHAPAIGKGHGPLNHMWKL